LPRLGLAARCVGAGVESPTGKENNRDAEKKKPLSPLPEFLKRRPSREAA